MVDRLGLRANGNKEAAVAALLRRVRERQEIVGYASDYRAWIQQVAPLDPA